jgi:hypothetical protein
MWKLMFPTLNVILTQCGRAHTVVPQNIDEFISQGRDVLSDFHHIIFCDTRLIPFPCLSCDVAPDEEMHDCFVPCHCLPV